MHSSPLSASALRGLVPVVCNTGDEVLYSQVRVNTARVVRMLKFVAEHDGHAVIVGGGPSLADTEREIRWRYDQGQQLFALNGTAKWLLERGMTPHYHILLDAREWNIRFLDGHSEATQFLLASQCHPSLFDALPVPHDVTMWHPNYDGQSGVIEHRHTVVVGGGASVGLCAAVIAQVLGFRKIHLYGFDSSYKDGEGHAYPQPENDAEGVIDVEIDGHKFRAASWMIRQAADFLDVAKALTDADCVLTVHGSGLLPYVAKKATQPYGRTKPPELLTLFYDLALAPASYDFPVVLCAAEQERVSRGLEGVRVVIVPGPNDGFRDDIIPPVEVEHRKNMLWNVVAASCQLVPSVKSVVVASSRDEAAMFEGGATYPHGYSVDFPTTRHGFSLLLSGMRNGNFDNVRAPRKALDLVGAWIPHNTITITLRETHYGTARNSATAAWVEAARMFAWHGYKPLFVRDTDHAFDAFNEFPTFPAASHSIAVRAALYELAAVNLFMPNGPACISYLNANSRSILFGLLCEELGESEREWAKKGFPVGSQWPNLRGHHRLVWEPDTADVIVSATLGSLAYAKSAA